MKKGAAVLRYDKLKSWDAEGKGLASRMEVNGDEISLVVLGRGCDLSDHDRPDIHAGEKDRGIGRRRR